jgi:GNAT superfamily N-acetyltransferase
MRKIDIKDRKETDVTDEALYALDKESHRIWAEQGMEAPWMHLTFEEFQERIRYVPMFVALDAETGELLGMHGFRPHRKQKWCYGFRLAVAEAARREGIASRMLEYETEFIRQKGYRYLKGVTGTTADWSIRWHLKNGYRIIGYYHSPNDNFTNYVFRKQLAPSVFWGPTLGPLTARLSFAASWLVNHLFKHSDGRDNLLGKVARRMVHRSA